jgi:hypothetical protein
MKTYSENQNKKPFDWNEALNRGCESMTLAEALDMRQLSKSWVTCACGNQCDVIPRDRLGAPEDEYLLELGWDFAEHVKCMYYAMMGMEESDIREHNADSSRRCAILTLKKIERRSQELIAVEAERACRNC